MSLAELNSNCSSRLRLLVFAHTDMAKRMAFFVCGVVTASVGRVYGGFQQFYPTQRMNWAPFYVVLIIVGLTTICLSLLPIKWIRRVESDRVERNDSTSFKILLTFAAAGLLLPIILSFVPPTAVQPPWALVYSICPACVLTLTVDSSLTSMIVLLAPINAAVFGAIGGVVGTVVDLLRK
jgi:hypothetical protein